MEHHKSAVPSPRCAGTRLTAMELHTGLMHSRDAYWHLLCLKTLMLGRAANFQSEDRSVMNLCYTPGSSSGLSLGSVQEGKAERWHITALAVGRGRELLLFLVSPVQLLRDQHHGLPWQGGVRLSLENGVTTAIFSSPEK